MSLLSILNLDVEIHVFHGQLCSTLLTQQHLALLHTVRVSLAGNLTPTGCGIFLPGNGTRMTHHFQHLLHISYNTKLIKEANYYVKYPLQLHLIGGGN